MISTQFVGNQFSDLLVNWGRNTSGQLGRSTIQTRLIQDIIRSALADELLFGRLTNGGKVIVSISNEGKVELQF